MGATTVSSSPTSAAGAGASTGAVEGAGAATSLSGASPVSRVTSSRVSGPRR